jgi:hypothetical protein
MAQQQSGAIPAGWIGGFAQSNPKFAYPNPDLSSLPLLDNMANIDKLQRQQKVCWPEFSWESVLTHPESRCFQMFSPDISRVGYTDEGRVYSIICPQQGSCSPLVGCLNIEVTVTGNRGWVDETTPSQGVAADLTTEGRIWFTPLALKEHPIAALLWEIFRKSGLPFPDKKANAIIVTLWNSHDTTMMSNHVLPGRSGETTRFESPPFAKHWKDNAWAVANLEVAIGQIKKTGSEIVDSFNQLVMDAFNVGSGNLLTPGNVLTWNVWFEEPALANQTEWAEHAEKWRESIDADHGAPTGPGTDPRYFDGTPFSPLLAALEKVIEEFIEWVYSHLPAEKVEIMARLEKHLTAEKVMTDKVRAHLNKHRAIK